MITIAPQSHQQQRKASERLNAYLFKERRLPQPGTQIIYEGQALGKCVGV